MKLRRRLLTAFVAAASCLLAAAAIPTLAQAAAASTFGRYAPRPAFSESVTNSFYVPMRDGVRLAFSVQRPARNGRPVEGKFPVVWTGGLDLPNPTPNPNPNAGAASGQNDWRRLVQQGYVVVTVARRGNGASFGVQRGYQDRQEAYDAYEITEWLAAQPWSTGKVGVYGCSNTGEAAMHAYSVAPPHLKAVWAGCFSWSKYDGFLRGGGIVANWGAGPTRTLEENLRARPVESDTDRSLLRKAAEEHLKNTNLSDLLQSLPFRDSWSPLTNTRFAYEGSVATYKAQLLAAAIPLYVQGGWNDDFRREQFITFANIPGTRVLIGPWGHCQSTGFDTIAEAQRFFDYHLKGIDTGIAKDDPIHYFAMGAPAGTEWRSARTWPGAAASTASLFLDAQGLAGAAPGRSGGETLTVDYDPRCVGPGGGASAGATPCHLGRGTVSFGQAVTRDTELTGHPLLDLWISSSTPDANIFAYLEDVAPDGTVRVITDARQKASLRKVSEPPYPFLGLPYHRGYEEDAQALVPGQPTRVQFDFLPVSYVVKAGHRLQLTISGSDPRERFRKTSAPAPTLTVHTGGANASRLILPAGRAA